MRHKPVTPSLRHTFLPSFPFLGKGKPLKSLTKRIKASAGRNNQGLITVYTKGGGHKRLYREVNFMNTISGIVESIEYDPYRSSFIARIFDHKMSKHSYILASHNLKKGHFINFSKHERYNTAFRIGNRYRLSDLPLGSVFHDFSFTGLKKRKIARSAGCSAVLLSKNKGLCRVRLPSGTILNLPDFAEVTLGIVSNPQHKNRVLGKAGRSRWLNRRPKVRGVAMNPIDHPHGGGEGKTSGGRPSVTPWGKPAHGVKTSTSKKRNFKYG